MTAPPGHWESIELHESYVRDDARNHAYRRALARVATPDSVVLDIGCGTGILSFFAVQAGCRRVYAVERTGLIRHARACARANGFQDRVVFIQKSILDVRLPEPVDIVIHDQIGVFLWDEGMEAKIGRARDRFLKPGGHILPSRFELYLAPIAASTSALDSRFWRRRHYGIDFSPFERPRLAQLPLRTRPRVCRRQDVDAFLSGPVLADRIDLRGRSSPRRTSVSWTIERKGRLSAVLGYLRILFDADIVIDTDPRNPATNWGQFILPLSDQRDVQRGDRIEVTVRPHVIPDRWRWTVSYGRSSRATGG